MWFSITAETDRREGETPSGNPARKAEKVKVLVSFQKYYLSLSLSLSLLPCFLWLSHPGRSTTRLSTPQPKTTCRLGQSRLWVLQRGTRGLVKLTRPARAGGTIIIYVAGGRLPTKIDLVLWSSTPTPDITWPYSGGGDPSLTSSLLLFVSLSGVGGGCG